MIIKLESLPSKNGKRSPIKNREVCVLKDFQSARIAAPKPLKVEFKKVVFAMPFLFLSGIFTGIAIMLALKD